MVSARDPRRPCPDPHGGPDGARGSGTTYDQLFNRWWSMVWRAARELLHCDADADEAAQRVFVRFLKRKPTEWSGIVSLENFFREAGRNEALMILRHDRRQERLADKLGAAMDPADLTTEMAEARTARNELRNTLAMLIEELPPRCQAVISSIVFDRLTHAEVADRLGISVKAVEKQVARARHRLRNRLTAMFPEITTVGASTFWDGGDEVVLGII